MVEAPSTHGATSPVPPPTLVQTFSLLVASVQTKASPVALLDHKVPTPLEGLVVRAGSLELFVIEIAVSPVKLEALIAGKAPDNFDDVNVEILASATVPVRFAADKFVTLLALIAPKVPVTLAAGKLVKADPSRAGKVPVTLADVKFVKLAPPVSYTHLRAHET